MSDETYFTASVTINVVCKITTDREPVDGQLGYWTASCPQLGISCGACEPNVAINDLTESIHEKLEELT